MILSSPPQTASTLLFANAPDKKIYWDRSHYDTPEAQVRALAKSSTLYIGNLTFSTRSHDIFAFFSSLGKVKKVHLGLDRYKKTPCGFAFVEYEERECALNESTYVRNIYIERAGERREACQDKKDPMEGMQVTCVQSHF